MRAGAPLAPCIGGGTERAGPAGPGSGCSESVTVSVVGLGRRRDAQFRVWRPGMAARGPRPLPGGSSAARRARRARGWGNLGGLQAADNAGALGWRLSEDEVDRLSALGRVGKTSVWQHDGR